MVSRLNWLSQAVDKMEKRNKKPNFKIDEIMLVLIVVVITVVVSIYDKKNHPNSIEAEKITELILDHNDISIVSQGSSIDQQKIKDIQEMSYSQLKGYFNVKNDFCIYIQDGNGDIILAKGSSKLSANGIDCKE